MTAAINYAMGSIVPPDPNFGIPSNMEALQKINTATLDTYFTDTVGARISRVIMVASDGFVTLEFVDGSTATVGMIQGVWYPVRCVRIQTSGTTVSGVQWAY